MLRCMSRKKQLRLLDSSKHLDRVATGSNPLEDLVRFLPGFTLHQAPQLPELVILLLQDAVFPLQRPGSTLAGFRLVGTLDAA